VEGTGTWGLQILGGTAWNRNETEQAGREFVPLPTNSNIVAIWKTLKCVLQNSVHDTPFLAGKWNSTNTQPFNPHANLYEQNPFTPI